MTKINSLLLFLGIIFFASCQSISNAEDLKEIELLEVKLTATEAQLLNVKSELAKCKKDSLSVEYED